MSTQLKAGFARTEITPPLGVPIAGYFVPRRATGVLDPLEVSCVALSDGSATALLMSLDLLGIKNACPDLCRRVAAATGLPEEAVLIHCTHTHTGPAVGAGDSEDGDAYPDGDETYQNFLAERLISAANGAIDDLAPATLSIARSEAPRISFPRRYRMKDGSIRTNPGVGNPDIAEPIGAPDETVQIVRIDREGATPIAILNFQTHPDVIGGTLISADWPGMARRTAEAAISGLNVVFVNGTQGDVNHVNVAPGPGEDNGLAPDFDDVPRGYAYSQHMGRVVAAALISSWGRCVPVAAGPLRFVRKDVSVPSNMPRPDQIPLAEKYDELHRAGRDCDIPFAGMELTTVVAEAARIMRLKDGPEAFGMPVSLIAIGESVAICGFPGEPFTDIGLRVKAGSPFAMTLCACLAGGSYGYFPTGSAYAEGGYEARSSIFGPTVADDLVAAALSLLSSQ